MHNKIFGLKKTQSLISAPIILLTLYIIACADILTIKAAGYNLRIAWLVLPFLFFLVKGKSDIVTKVFMVAFFVAHVIAALVSFDPISGILYSLWVPFNYLAFFRIAYGLATELKDNLFSTFIIIGRVQIVTSTIFVLIGLHERAQFILYEPSYFAISLIPYIISTIYISQKIYFDLLLLLVALITSQSANLLLIYLVTFIFWQFNNNIKIRYFFLTILSTPLLGYLYLQNQLQDEASPNNLLARLILNMDFSWENITLILERSGNRIPRIQAAIQLLNENGWFFGIGPGLYPQFTKGREFIAITNGIPSLDPAGLPVTNIFLESIVNAGITGFVILILYLLYVKDKIAHHNVPIEKNIMNGIFIILIFSLMIESNYLRAYIWVIIGACMGKINSRKRC